MPLVAFDHPSVGSLPPPAWRATCLFSEKVITITTLLADSEAERKETSLKVLKEKLLSRYNRSGVTKLHRLYTYSIVIYYVCSSRMKKNYLI